ncbi:S-layer homology domain-containing protein [Candidatus Formimonas warabiya]|uniref:SLH domain-containing protein n=1 Tax=Formimonas warabiya TaxID=1761012 RepID=A0A3G1KQ55_FORW1|nr:S-layer homology domain-containing protein [Candidatus Formimonas warabiya]ATW24566.1 hypothetical protein DCMF_07005 [Candidatus Formimonas warabiya]
MKTYRLLDLIPEDNQTGKFQDVDPKRWYASAVEKAAGLGVVSGTSEAAFEPENRLLGQRWP